MLDNNEQVAMELTAKLWGILQKVVVDGPNHDADLAELVIPIHWIQRYILAQEGCRANPSEYRLLGDTLRTPKKSEKIVVPEKTNQAYIDSKAERIIDRTTGEITEPKSLDFGEMFNPDCPKGQESCNISEKFAHLSRIKFRKTLCEGCFKAHI